MNPKIVSLAVVALLTLAPQAGANLLPTVMPVPAEMRAADGVLGLGRELTVAFAGVRDDRVLAAVDRMAAAWQKRLAIACKVQGAPADAAVLVIDCAKAAPVVPSLADDESYTLDVTARRIVLKAPTTTGALRGLATLTQLLVAGHAGPTLPAVSIRDQPRFAWRGVLIDVARHWQPMEVIKRELDGMALVKLNVLHLHLTDDQGFRIESRKHPELHTQGSDGHYFTQDQMRELLAYAHARGIRIIPEFDMPGHCTAWLVSHPEVGSAPGPYSICRRWGVENPVLDPTNEALYPLLDDFIGEMAALFPDAYLHIGGDENNGVHWSANAHIQGFIREHGLKDNPGLHAWFNRRLGAILAKHGKKLIGWDEILHPDLPKESVVQSWRGPEGLAAAAQAGHQVLLSNGYYVDLNQPATEHYAIDPVPADSPLTPAQRALVLGGEATMWSEWVTPDNIDTRIWPRTAAIAERLWSPREATDAATLYPRLVAVEAHLRAAGLFPHEWPRIDLPAVDPKGTVADALRTLASVVEPVKIYRRGELQPDIGALAPLNDLADWAGPESRPARDFGDALERWLLADGAFAADGAKELTAKLRDWGAAGELAATAPADASPRAQGRVQVGRSLAALGKLGNEAIAALLSGKQQPAAWAAAAKQALESAAPNAAAVEFPFLPQLRLLTAAASADPALRSSLPRAAWRARLEASK